MELKPKDCKKYLQIFKDLANENRLTEEEVSDTLGLKHVENLEKNHKWQKNAQVLGVGKLRELLKERFQGKRGSMNDFEYSVRVEKFLDNQLASHGYNVQNLLSKYRK